MQVDRAGQLCGTKPCWKAVSTKGYKYGDKLAAAESAAGSSAKSGVKKAKKLVKKSAALVKKVSTKLGSKKGQKTFTDAAERSALKADADAVRTLLLALSGSLG